VRKDPNMIHETKDEKESESPFQSLLECAFLLQKFDRILKDLESPSNHTDVQEAASADN
jgi:hypothetical protein